MLTDYPPPEVLFDYLPEYKVVICTPCKYALQPDGIARHLKSNHHIFRHHRRPYMSHVQRMRLDQPADMTTPRACDFPVPQLPVHDGLGCLAPGCFYLCVSEKRMRGHWTSVHGRPGEPGVDWRHRPLQTFFRGNLLKYFTTWDVPTGGASLGAESETSGFSSVSRQSSIPTQLSDFGSNTEALSPTYYGSDYSIKLDAVDSILLDHYTTATSLTLATDDDTARLWQTSVPEIAKHHDFLLHAILACSAFHLLNLAEAKTVSLPQRDLSIKARGHLDLAMPLFRAAIANVNEDNCHAVLIFMHLLVVYSFASEKPVAELFPVAPNDAGAVPSWLYFLRTGCSTLCTVWHSLTSGPVGALALQWDIPVVVKQEDDVMHNDVRRRRQAVFASVVPAITSSEAWSAEQNQLYYDAADQLDIAFASISANRAPLTTWDALRIWPMCISDSFLAMLCDQHPGAMILLAHYCLLLKASEGKSWYFDGRAASLLGRILQSLDVKWYPYIKGPVNQLIGRA